MSQQPNTRYERAKPKSEEEYADLHEKNVEQFGLEAKYKDAVKRGSSLMVFNSVEGVSVPYEEFVSRNAESGDKQK